MPLRVSILSIGDELILGQGLDQNSAWLSAALLRRSALTVEHRTVADDRAAIAAAVRDLARDADLLLLTGGLGPTDDDLTRHALGDVLAPGAPLVTDREAEATLLAWFEGRGHGMPDSNRRQAERPETMRMVPNPRGTAPGLAGDLGSCRIVAMPGPPREMRPMFDEHVAPHLPEPRDDERIACRTVHLYGLGESRAAERLGDLTARDRAVVVGITVSAGIVSARVRTQGVDAEAVAEATAVTVEDAWRPYVFGRDDATLSAAVGALLRTRGRSLVTAESCTGGGLGRAIVDTPGSSAYYRGGWVTYANERKSVDLDVPPTLIETHGAVSAEVAEAMAVGALARGETDESLAITGVAGPADSHDTRHAKPAGRVYIALARRTDADSAVAVRRFKFPGERRTVRDRSVKAALQMLRFALLDVGPRRLLIWEEPA